MYQRVQRRYIGLCDDLGRTPPSLSEAKSKKIIRYCGLHIFIRERSVWQSTVCLWFVIYNYNRFLTEDILISNAIVVINRIPLERVTYIQTRTKTQKSDSPRHVLQ